MLRRTLLLLLLLALPVRAHALDFAGEEFQANTYTSSDQYDPSAAGLADGNFVVVWGSGSSDDPQDGDLEGVFGQRFTPVGVRVGTEFRVNTYTTSSQRLSAVAGRPQGGFVVVWQSYAPDGDGYAVMGQRFNANGAAAGAEFQANTYTGSYQYHANVAAASNGFVVVWESYDQDGQYGGIFGQRFDNAGARAGTEFRVNTYTTGLQRFPQVGSATDGRFVVVWQSEPGDLQTGQDGSDGGIFGQRFGADGAKAGTEFHVNTYTPDRQVLPAVAMAADGTFVVAWESRQPLSTLGPDEVQAQRFGADGAPLGTEFRVNTYTTTFEEDVHISVTPGGTYLVVWETENGGVVGTDSSGESIVVRQLDADATPLGTEFQVNTFTTGDQDDPGVAALAGGGFAVVWQSYEQDGAWSGVFGQALGGSTCADANADGKTTASDALQALKTAVGSAACVACICDVNASGGVNTTDALIILRVAVGQSLTLQCPAC